MDWADQIHHGIGMGAADRFFLRFFSAGKNTLGIDGYGWDLELEI